jgi:hypothetical protein
VEIVARGLDMKYGNGAVHTFLRITPDNPKDFGQIEGYSFTLGGYDVGTGKLEKRMNYGIDPGITNDKAKMVADVKTPDGMTDTEYIQKIQGAYDSYENNENYNSLSINKYGYNCNNFSTSLIEKSGGNLPKKFNPGGFNPGLGERMPSIKNTNEIIKTPSIQKTENNVGAHNQTSSSGWFAKAWSNFKSKISNK